MPPSTSTLVTGLQMAIGLMLLFSFSCSNSGSESNAPSGLVRIAAAADLRFALDSVCEEFHRLHPGWKTEVSYGASGSLHAQIVNRAPFELFLSADRDDPQSLVQAGVSRQEDLFDYGMGRLVLWMKQAPGTIFDANVLVSPAIHKIAIANPKHAPYGRAAVAALKSLGLFDRVEQKLVYGDNVVQTAQFVQSGAADAGLISHSLASSRELRDQGAWWELPANSYPPIIQAGLVLAGKDRREPAIAFRDYLLGDGQALLEKHGFQRVGSQ